MYIYNSITYKFAEILFKYKEWFLDKIKQIIATTVFFV